MLTDVLILLRTQPPREAPETVARLLRLAATFATHATLAPLEVFVPPLRQRWSSTLLGFGQVAADLERASHAASRELQALPLETPGLEVTAHPLRGSLVDPASPLTAAARYHDLTMIAFTDAEIGAAMAEAAMFGTGRPTLLLPAPVTDEPQLFDRIAVAWDGSGPANRALQNAMPFLRKAKEVVVIDAPGDKKIAPDDRAELEAYLVRHGIAPRFVSADTSMLDIGLALQHCARGEGAGLLVMGAYGHSRVQQFILGGATRGVLADLQLPVLMSHA